MIKAEIIIVTTKLIYNLVENNFRRDGKKNEKIGCRGVDAARRRGKKEKEKTEILREIERLRGKESDAGGRGMEGREKFSFVLSFPRLDVDGEREGVCLRASNK